MYNDSEKDQIAINQLNLYHKKLGRTQEVLIGSGKQGENKREIYIQGDARVDSLFKAGAPLRLL